MEPQREERRLTTILAADVVGHPESSSAFSIIAEIRTMSDAGTEEIKKRRHSIASMLRRSRSPLEG